MILGNRSLVRTLFSPLLALRTTDPPLPDHAYQQLVTIFDQQAVDLDALIANTLGNNDFLDDFRLSEIALTCFSPS